MKQNSLNRGNEINDQISGLKVNLIVWQKARNLAGVSVKVPYDGDRLTSEYADFSFIPFDVIKILSIDGLQKKIKSLEEELESL